VIVGQIEVGKASNFKPQALGKPRAPSFKYQINSVRRQMALTADWNSSGAWVWGFGAFPYSPQILSNSLSSIIFTPSF
jgi:hypothetical protein